jgi:hypothetical protein
LVLPHGALFSWSDRNQAEFVFLTIDRWYFGMNKVVARMMDGSEEGMFLSQIAGNEIPPFLHPIFEWDDISLELLNTPNGG